MAGFTGRAKVQGLVWLRSEPDLLTAMHGQLLPLLRALSLLLALRLTLHVYLCLLREAHHAVSASCLSVRHESNVPFQGA